MDYKLAKELKHAGFAQDIQYCEVCFCVLEDGDQLIVNYGCDQGLHSESDGEIVKIPTLSELIEACGDEFKCLIKYPEDCELENKFATFTQIGNLSMEDSVTITESIGYDGKTPREAVARLWLALNKK